MAIFQFALSALVLLSPYALATMVVLNKPGQAVTVDVAAGKSAIISLALDEGDYIAGAYKLTSGITSLSLMDAKGQPVRQLLHGKQYEDEVFFIAAQGMSLQLIATASATAEITLAQRVALSEQREAAPGYLSARIATLAKALADVSGADQHAQDAALTRRFWQAVEQEGTPLIEPFDEHQAVMTFLVRGAQRNVVVIGAPANGKPPLDRLGQSDVWFKSFIVPLSTRLSYRLAIDAPDLPASANGRWGKLLSVAQADPLNHHPWPADAPDVYRQESSIVLPKAPAEYWSKPRRPAAAKGQLISSQFTSKQLGNQREISLYRSANFSPTAPDAVLLFIFDARDYLSRVPTPRMLDNMVAAGRLPPVAAVFVGNSSREGRARELPNNPEFARFMAQELYPWAAAQLQVEIPAARTILAGSSFGGLASVTVAARHPDVFGNALVLSGSFWWKEPEAAASDSPLVARLIANQPRLPLRLFMSAGLFEGASDSSPNILDSSRHVRDLLTSKGYDFHYREYASGHDYLAWQVAFADGLLALMQPAQQRVVTQ